jgi:hypothetical protein
MTATNAFFTAMDARRLGENGAPKLTAAGVGDSLVALFFKLVRGIPDQTLTELMKAVPEDGAADLCVLAMQTRATRGMGKGEKECFLKMQYAVAQTGANRGDGSDRTKTHM